MKKKYHITLMDLFFEWSQDLDMFMFTDNRIEDDEDEDRPKDERRSWDVYNPEDSLKTSSPASSMGIKTTIAGTKGASNGRFPGGPNQTFGTGK